MLSRIWRSHRLDCRRSSSTELDSQLTLLPVNVTPVWFMSLSIWLKWKKKFLFVLEIVGLRVDLKCSCTIFSNPDIASTC